MSHREKEAFFSSQSFGDLDTDFLLCSCYLNMSPSPYVSSLRYGLTNSQAHWSALKRLPACSCSGGTTKKYIRTQTIHMRAGDRVGVKSTIGCQHSNLWLSCRDSNSWSVVLNGVQELSAVIMLCVTHVYCMVAKCRGEIYSCWHVCLSFTPFGWVLQTFMMSHNTKLFYFEDKRPAWTTHIL